MMRDFLNKTELLAALRAGKRLEGGPRTDYAGEAVEHAPREDKANGHPDFYPWHIVGRPDWARLPRTGVVVVEGATR
ncbi:hypothetical protein [Streptomyces europaeiscabiei]|uniref:hypothetical protein n=1 Tax=Streptomyces europaeiscabiei TaxID=146819 RepID=UPI002E103D31|nr:hypothetical protein OHB30_33225 [Streptomyces europaeiscabiei]